ncbi:MAG: hypothetical protein Q9214_001128 [Letrouitia sp. 1 TL-2023]
MSSSDGMTGSRPRGKVMKLVDARRLPGVLFEVYLESWEMWVDEQTAVLTLLPQGSPRQRMPFLHHIYLRAHPVGATRDTRSGRRKLAEGTASQLNGTVELPGGRTGPQRQSLDPGLMRVVTRKVLGGVNTLVMANLRNLRRRIASSPTIRHLDILAVDNIREFGILIFKLKLVCGSTRAVKVQKEHQSVRAVETCVYSCRLLCRRNCPPTIQKTSIEGSSAALESTLNKVQQFLNVWSNCKHSRSAVGCIAYLWYRMPRKICWSSDQ